ncbi:MAG TPA: TonB-dependent receptor, partial [Thermoanaerobaculia bacterium]|nr:TonB-dependent receptor [Thermoanaerobaculia bacterium]
RPEAASDQSDRTENLGIFGDSVFSERLFGDLKAGIVRTTFGLSPRSGDEALSGSYDQNSGVSSVNATRVVHQKTRRGEVTGSVSISPDNGGKHLVKAGADFDWTRLDQQARPTGTPLDPEMCSPAYGQPPGARCGALATTQSGAPYRFDVFTILPDATFHGRGRSFFLQDEWRPLSSLTIRIGARYDNVSYFLDDGSKAKTLTRFQPRVGIAWDPGQSGKTVLRVQAGDFMDDNGLRLTSFLDRRGAVDSAFLWDPGSGRYLPYFHQGGPSGNSLDPALRPTHSTEINLGVTRRIAANTVADVSGVWRKSYDLWEDACRYGDCRLPGSSLWMTNRPDGQDVLRSQYQGILVKIESRPTDRLHLLFSYVFSRTRGSVADYNQSEDFDFYPDNYVNRFGYLPGDARGRVKLDGFVRLPARYLFATHVYWDSGSAYTVTVPSDVAGSIFLEPRGSRRLPHYSQWDLQIRKDLPFGPLRISLIATVYNVLDTEIPAARDGNVGASGTLQRPTNPRFNYDTAWQHPRHYEGGVRIEF